MDKAPFHIPVFQNDYIILLNVNIPPGRNTGYHTHYADSVSVNLMPASQRNQNYGSNEVSAPGTGGEGEPGRATFTDITKNGPRTHKATNVGPTPFHNISFIFRKPGPAGNTVSDRVHVNGYTQIMDNARIRAWRLVLNLGNQQDRSRNRLQACASMSMAACSPKSFRGTPTAAWRPTTVTSSGRMRARRVRSRTQGPRVSNSSSSNSNRTIAQYPVGCSEGHCRDTVDIGD